MPSPGDIPDNAPSPLESRPLVHALAQILESSSLALQRLSELEAETSGDRVSGADGSVIIKRCAYAGAIALVTAAQLQARLLLQIPAQDAGRAMAVSAELSAAASLGEAQPGSGHRLAISRPTPVCSCSDFQALWPGYMPRTTIQLLSRTSGCHQQTISQQQETSSGNREVSLALVGPKELGWMGAALGQVGLSLLQAAHGSAAAEPLLVAATAQMIAAGIAEGQEVRCPPSHPLCRGLPVLFRQASSHIAKMLVPLI